MWKNSCSLYIDFIQMQCHQSIHPSIQVFIWQHILAFLVLVHRYWQRSNHSWKTPLLFSKDSVCADELDPTLPAVFSSHRLAGSLTETPLWLSLIIVFTSVLTYISSSIFTQTTTHSTCCSVSSPQSKTRTTVATCSPRRWSWSSSAV